MFFRVIARPLLATWFVYGGVQSVLEPEERAKRAAPVVEPLLRDAGFEDVKTTDVVKLHGVATVVAASVLALSRTPRTAGLVLAGLAAATAVAGRPFWRESNEAKREAEKEQFLKNVSLTGGALLAATAGHGTRHKAKAKARKVKLKEEKAAKEQAEARAKDLAKQKSKRKRGK